LFDFFGATLIVDGPDTGRVVPAAGALVAPRGRPGPARSKDRRWISESLNGS
jgi:hypothetical protein